MATKRRTDYQVDEEALKRMMAGDVTALDKMASPAEASGPDEYRRRFLKERLSGSRRQTYIHDALYRTVAKLLPVIAPDMSVPMFLGSVLSDHLERYQDVINEIYNQEANQNPLEWKK